MKKRSTWTPNENRGESGACWHFERVKEGSDQLGLLLTRDGRESKPGIKILQASDSNFRSLFVGNYLCDTQHLLLTRGRSINQPKKSHVQHDHEKEMPLSLMRKDDLERYLSCSPNYWGSGNVQTLKIIIWTALWTSVSLLSAVIHEGSLQESVSYSLWISQL